MPSSSLHRCCRGLAASTFIFLLAACSTPSKSPSDQGVDEGNSSRVQAAKGGAPARPQAAPPVQTPAVLPLPDTAKVSVSWSTIGQSVEGRPIHCATLGSGPDSLLIIATIHGNEAAGTPLVQRFLREVEEAPSLLVGRTLSIVPVANPDGLARSKRRNPEGVDLNRNFPADNYRGTRGHGKDPLSQPESRALHQLILDLKPSRVVSIHQPLKCVDWDGPAERLARAMAGAGPLPAKRLGSRPGSLGSWVGLTLNIPIITLELPRSADRLSEDVLYANYGPMLIAALSFR